SEALWYGTREEFAEGRSGELIRDFHFGRQDVRTLVYTVVDDLAPAPLDVLADHARSWLDDPFDLEETGRGPMQVTGRTPSTSTPSRCGSATSPTNPRARKRSPAASSPATSPSAPGYWRRAPSASPRGPSCAPSTPVNPSRSSPSTRSRSAT